jgi:hypothetical protein
MSFDLLFFEIFLFETIKKLRRNVRKFMLKTLQKQTIKNKE